MDILVILETIHPAFNYGSSVAASSGGASHPFSLCSGAALELRSSAPSAALMQSPTPAPATVPIAVPITALPPAIVAIDPPSVAPRAAPAVIAARIPICFLLSCWSQRYLAFLARRYLFAVDFVVCDVSDRASFGQPVFANTIQASCRRQCCSGCKQQRCIPFAFLLFRHRRLHCARRSHPLQQRRVPLRHLLQFRWQCPLRRCSQRSWRLILQVLHREPRQLQLLQEFPWFSPFV